MADIYSLGDYEQPNKKFGGDLEVGDIHYFGYAEKGVSRSSKRPDMVNWIREFCESTNAFDTDLTRFKHEPGNNPLVEIHVHPVKERPVTGLDKKFCTKGFEAAIDHCELLCPALLT